MLDELVMIFKLIISLIITLLLSYATGETYRAGYKIPTFIFLAITILFIGIVINYLRALP